MTPNEVSRLTQAIKILDSSIVHKLSSLNNTSSDINVRLPVIRNFLSDLKDELRAMRILLGTVHEEVQQTNTLNQQIVDKLETLITLLTPPTP